MNKITRTGADLAKNVIQVHAVDAAGKVVTSQQERPHLVGGIGARQGV